MSPLLQDLLNAVLRWLHVVASVLWLGHIYFVNLVQSHLAASWALASKRDVQPLLVPRVYFWLRWASVVTVGSGFMLLGVVYQVGGLMIDHDTQQQREIATAVGFAAMVAPFFLYDALWKSKLGQRPTGAAVVSLALFGALVFGLAQAMSGRALYIHMGGMFGVVMALNIWLRIWPAQKKLLAEVNALEVTLAVTEAAALSSRRSRHNVLLSVPLTFFMVSNHFPTLYTHELGPLFAVLIAGMGFAVGWLLLRKSASAGAASI